MDQGVYFEPRSGGEVIIFGFYTNKERGKKETNKINQKDTIQI